MKRLLSQLWRETDGVLSFEWTLLITVVVIGIVSGLAGARDAIIDELGDFAEAAQALDQSFTLAAFSYDYDGDGTDDITAPGMSFTEMDGVDNLFTDCARVDSQNGFDQGPSPDNDS